MAHFILECWLFPYDWILFAAQKGPGGWLYKESHPMLRIVVAIPFLKSLLYLKILVLGISPAAWIASSLCSEAARGGSYTKKAINLALARSWLFLFSQAETSFACPQRKSHQL
ncbi:MAG: hypothetical protein KJO86_06965 [Muriicola sp.]|nr:hypothetical protein [Muriicola sp.]